MNDGLLVIGSQFRSYIVLRKLGIGGTGEVYLVRHEVLGVNYAVKVIEHGVIDEDVECKTRFLREVRVAASIHHQSLVAVHDAGFDDVSGLYFVVMDYLPGGTVADELSRLHRFSVEKALRVVLSVAKGLDELHRHHIVHRDVKPSNMLIAEDESIKLADFGIARVGDSGARTITQTGFALGTPAYMPYEQIVDSHAVDGRTDIYALGVSLYELLTGVLPDGELSSTKLLKKRISGERIPDIRRTNSAIPDWLADIIGRMIEPDVRHRLVSLDDLIRLFQAHLSERRSARNVFVPQMVEKARRSLGVTMIGACLGVVAVGIGVTWLFHEEIGLRLVSSETNIEQTEDIEDEVRCFADQTSEPCTSSTVLSVRVVTNEVVRVITVTNIVEQKDVDVSPSNTFVASVSNPMLVADVGLVVLTNVAEGVAVFGPVSCESQIMGLCQMISNAAAIVRQAHGLRVERPVQRIVKTVEVVPGEEKYVFDAASGKVRVGAAYGCFPYDRVAMGKMCVGFMTTYSEGFDDAINRKVNSYIRLCVLANLTGNYGLHRLQKAVAESPEMRILQLTQDTSKSVLARYFRIRRESYASKKLFFSMSIHDFAAVLSKAYGESVFPFLRRHGLKVDEFASNIRIRGMKRAEFFGE